MAQSLANFDAALKDDYGPGLHEAVNNKSAVWSQVAINDEDIQGRQAVWSVHSGRSNSTGSRGELGTLPTADRQRYDQVRDNLADVYHTIKVSGPAQHLTKNDSGSFTRALEAELRGAEKDFSNENARQAYNDVVTISSTLYLGAITGTASTNYGAPTFTFGTAATSTFRHFFVNMAVDVINGSTGAVRGSTTVASVDKDAKTVTLNDSVASAATGDYLARSGNFAAADTWGYERNGLPYILGSEVYCHLDPATAPLWQGNAVGDSTTGISEVLFETANDLVNTDGDGGDIDLWIAEQAQRRKLAQVMQAQKRYDGRQATLKAGWKGLQLEQGVLIVDKYCPSNRIFGINTSEIARFVGLDFTWDEDDGRVLIRALDGSDAVEGRYKTYDNLEVTNRNSHVVITLKEPTF